MSDCYKVACSLPVFVSLIQTSKEIQAIWFQATVGMGIFSTFIFQLTGDI